MSSIRKRGALPLVLAALALAAAAAGGAWAASSGGKTITVCVKKKGGALYKAKKCAKHDSKLSWNKVGPAGAAGKNGTNGTNGLPAVAYYAADSHQYEFTPATSDYEPILRLSLPAGDYSITGNVGVEAADIGDASATYQIECEMVDGSNSEVEYQDGLTSGPLDLARNTLSFGLDVDTTATTEVAIECENQTNSGNASFIEKAGPSQISAVQVQSTHDGYIEPM